MNPALHCFLIYSLVAVCLAFVPPRTWMRLCTTALCNTCIVFLLFQMDRTRSSRVLLQLTGQWTCYAVVCLNHTLVLTMKTPPSGSNTAGRLKWAYELLLNPRGIGSSSRNGKIPPFSRRDPNYVPSRYGFIARRLATALITFTIYKTFTAVKGVYFYALRDGDYGEEKRGIIRRLGTGGVSMRELYIRAWLTVDFLLTGHCILRALHSMVSAFAVALGDEPRRWPPLLGDIREAYSLRRFRRHVFLRCSPATRLATNVCPAFAVLIGTA
jgi:hypothetical protein